jgi:hypothetical protein
MGDINTSFTERVRYTLFHKESGSLILKNDPKGWNEDQKEIARNKDYHGIFASFSNNLRFVGDAKDFIQSVYDVYGINADIRLKKEILHPKTDLWVDDYSGYLDLSTREVQDNKLACKFNSGGLEQILKARESEQLELDRETSIDGITIEPLAPKQLKLDGRRIFLKSRWETDTDNNGAYFGIQSRAGAIREATVAIPLVLKSKSHEEAQDASNLNQNIPWEGSVAAYFIAKSEVDRTLNISFNLSFLIKIFEYRFVSAFKFAVFLTVYNEDESVFSRITLEEFTNDYYLQGKRIDINFQETVTITKGQSISLELYEYANFMNVDFTQPTAIVRFTISNIICSVTVEEDSKFDPTTSKFLLVHDVFSRLCDIITNKKYNFHSKYFGRKDLGYSKDGPGAFFGLTHGFWVRGFDKLPLSTEENPNLFKPMTTSFRDALDSFSCHL